jgi:hypothetical protein
MCKRTNMNKFLDLGVAPPSDNFLTKEQLNDVEKCYPLNVYMCYDCGLCQLGYVVPRELMFNENYPYESSMTKTGSNHFISMAIDICKKYELTPGSLVIDVGSNVGVLLSGFKSQGLRVLGIEPSSNVAKIAIKNGIDTISEFFSSNLALKIRQQMGNASVITATNVFAHVDDLYDFVKAADILLTEKGIIVIEAPYLVNMLDNLEYDTIYHEHLSYLSVKPMTKFFSELEMDVFDVERQSIHGGTLRYFIGRKGKRRISQNIAEFLLLEEKKGIYSEKHLKKFAEDVKNHCIELNAMLTDLKRHGKKIVGISAPAKGNTLLNYCKIGPETLDYITEKSTLKIGKYTPGMHIPVYSEDVLLKDKPDYALILAWNFAEEIMRNNEQYRNNGGRFIVPTPHPRII